MKYVILVVSVIFILALAPLTSPVLIYHDCNEITIEWVDPPYPHDDLVYKSYAEVSFVENNTGNILTYILPYVDATIFYYYYWGGFITPPFWDYNIRAVIVVDDVSYEVFVNSPIWCHRTGLPIILN